MLKVFKRFKSLYEYLNGIDDIYKFIEEYNPIKKKENILIVFDDVIADMLSSKMQSKSNWITYLSMKTKYFYYCYYTIFFYCSEKH